MWLNSYVEAITLRVAFEEYLHVWQLMGTAGFTLLPFLFYFLSGVGVLYRDHSALVSLHSLLNQFEIKFLKMGLGLMLACQPMIRCEFEFLSDGRILHEECGDELKLPLLWAGLMNIFGLVFQGLSQGVGSGLNARAAQVSLDLAVIQDVRLLLEIRSFVQDCYQPSVRRYVRESEKDNEQGDRHDELLQQQLNSHLWLGSEYFLMKTGYYDYFSASNASTGDVADVEENQDQPSSYSYLSCKVWWEDPQKGLKKRLIVELQSKVPGLVQYVKDGNWQIFLKQFLQHSLQTGYSSSVAMERHRQESGVMGWVSRFFGHYGLAEEAIAFYPLMSVILEGLPLFQSLILMAGIIFYPFWVLLVSYDIGAIMRYLIGWASILAWSYFWVIAQHIDNVLIQTFYPGLSFDLPGKLLIDMVALLMVIILPGYWMIVVKNALRSKQFHP